MGLKPTESHATEPATAFRGFQPDTQTMLPLLSVLSQVTQKLVLQVFHRQVRTWQVPFFVPRKGPGFGQLSSNHPQTDVVKQG